MPTHRDRSQTHSKGSQKDRSGKEALSSSPDSQQDFAAGLIKLIPDGQQQALLTKALELIADLFVYDLVEINLLDESQGCFLPVRWASARGRSFLANYAAENYQLGEGYTGWLAEHQTPLLISDTRTFPGLNPKGGLENFPFGSYVGIPLCWEQELLGTIEIAHHSTSTYTEKDREALILIASQLALGLRVSRLQQRDIQHTLHQDLSNEIYQLTGEIDNLNGLWENLSRTFLDHLQLNLLGIFIHEERASQLATPYLFRKLRKGWDYDSASLSTPVGSDLTAIWLYQEYWLSNDLDHQLISALGLDPILKRQSVKRILLVPLLVGTERLGLIVFGRSKALPPFDEDESQLLVSLGRQAGYMLYSSLSLNQAAGGERSQTDQNAKLSLREIEDSISPERMADLIRISAELTTSLDIDLSLSRILKLCNELMLADRSLLFTRDISSHELHLRQVMPESDSGSSQHLDALISTGKTMSEWVITRRQTLQVDDLSQDLRWPLENYRSVCAFPCLSADDVSGVLLVFAKREAAFDTDLKSIGQLVARQMASALNNTYLYSVIREQADRLGLMLRSQQIETSQSNAILESIADGVIVTNTEHRVILFNTAAERILNLTSMQVVGKEVFEFIGIFGSETPQWAETIRRWRITPSDKHQRPAKPERMILEDGRIISILPAPVVLGEDFLGTVSIFRDITRDVEVDRLKSEFVATVSHELRTPMTSIKGFVDLMLMGAAGELNDEQRHFLEIVRTNTNRLQILVNDLLDISKIEAGKASLIFQELNVHQLLAEMEQYIQHRSQQDAKVMHFSSQAPKELPAIWGDLERVRQILANIVENSFVYTPEGGAIELRARSVDDQVEIDVIDNGMGISLEEQERIFERFYRGEQSLIMGVAGTGLGLAIVLNLVEMHQGRIWVTSEGIPGKGTTFTISLPSVPPGTAE